MNIQQVNHLPPLFKPQDEQSVHFTRTYRQTREARQLIKQRMFDLLTWKIFAASDGRTSISDIADNMNEPVAVVAQHSVMLESACILCSIKATAIPSFIQHQTVDRNRRANDLIIDATQPLDKAHQDQAFNARELIDMVLREKGGQHDARMAVYMMMASIPRELLKENNITSFKYIDEDIFITDKRLIRLMIEEASKILDFNVTRALSQDVGYLDMTQKNVVNMNL